MVRAYLLGFYTESGIRYKVDEASKKWTPFKIAEHKNIANIGLLIEGDSEAGRLIRVAFSGDEPVTALMDGLGAAFGYEVSGWRVVKAAEPELTARGTLNISRAGKTRIVSTGIKAKNFPLYHGDHLAGVVNAFFMGLGAAEEQKYSLVSMEEASSPQRLYAPFHLIQGERGLYAATCDPASAEFSLGLLEGDAKELLSTAKKPENPKDFTDLLGNEAKKGEVVTISNLDLATFLKNL